MTEPASEKPPFDYYAATLAAGITGPFTIWGLYVVSPNYWIMAIGCVLFISFVFWCFGKIRIG
jgi:4-amino-4-deoxy-L-arabinose transferase-like glycosyltransferase